MLKYLESEVTQVPSSACLRPVKLPVSICVVPVVEATLRSFPELFGILC